MSWEPSVVEAAAAVVGLVITILGVINTIVMNQVRLELANVKLELEKLKGQMAVDRLQHANQLREEFKEQFMDKESTTGWIKSIDQRLTRVEDKLR